MTDRDDSLIHGLFFIKGERWTLQNTIPSLIVKVTYTYGKSPWKDREV